MTSNTVTASIIMPTFNRASIIPRSIKSVLRQTMPDFELIIIDDASTDDTQQVVRSFEDPRIIYIKRAVNHLELYKKTGETDNPRNDGLKRAGGQYISYLDSDDMYFSHFLEEMTRYMDRHPEVHFAYCDAVWHRNLDGKEEMANCNLSVDYGPAIMKHRNIIRTPTVMHRREVIEKVGYFKPIKVRVPHPDTPYVGIEDWDYWVRISKHYPPKHHPVVLAHKINETSDHYDDVEFDPEFAEADVKESERSTENKDLFYQVKILSDFQALTKKIAGIEGYLEPLEGYALFLLAAHGSGEGAIVEIGSFLGRSTSFLALGSKSTKRERVTAIDHFQGSREHQKGKRFECSVLVEEGTTYNRFMENIRSLEVEDYVEAVAAGSEEAAANWTQPIRLLFIDGDHSYENSKLDFELWSKFVIPGGYIGFHDVDTWPGVSEFYHELMAETRYYQQVLAADTLRVIQKAREE